MEPRTTIVPVLLPNGKEIRVEATLLPGEEEVAFKALPAAGDLRRRRGDRPSGRDHLPKGQAPQGERRAGLGGRPGVGPPDGASGQGHGHGQPEADPGVGWRVTKSR